MAKCNRPATARVSKMFTYIKFEDGVKAIVDMDDIADFDLQNIQFDKKYQVKWDDGNFYYGILGKIQQKAILEETKEAVDEKVKCRRVEFPPFSLCISATEVETESDLDRGDSLKREDMKNKVAAKIKKLNIELVEKENTNNFTPSIVNGTNVLKTAELKNQEPNTFGSNVSEKQEMPCKESTKNQKQNEIKKSLSTEKNSTSTSLKQSVSIINKKTDKRHKLKSGKAGDRARGGKSDAEFVSSYIQEIVDSNNKEIASPAVITKSNSKLCPTLHLTDCSIAHDNIGALHSSITKGQSRTNENKAGTKPSHKTQREKNDLVPAGFKQRTEEPLSTKSNHAQLQSKTNQDEALKKKMEKLWITNEDVQRKNLQLKNHIKDKERVINDLMTLNMELQSKVIEEYPKLHQINEEIQIKVLSNFNELMYLMSEYFKRHPMKHEDRVGDLPVGYRNIERNEVYLGYGVYICARQYDAVCVISKTMPQFVKNLAVAVFGINTLKESSVTGARSNRNKNKVQEAPRPALDSTKLQALRAVVKHYAMSEKGQDEITADYEAQQIGTHIAHKIYELNNPPNRNKTQHKKIVPAQVYEVINNFENTGRNDPKNNNVPNNVNSSASSSHSVTEVNNNASEEHGPLSKISLSDAKDNECEDVTFSDKENDEKGSVLSSTTHGVSDTSQNSTDDIESDLTL